MATDIKQWCATQMAAVCAPREAIEATVNLSKTLLNGNDADTDIDQHDSLPRGQYVLHHVYPHLLRRGYSLPLNVVMDLTCAYLDGLAIDFQSPQTWPDAVCKDMADSYCTALREANYRGELRETITQCRNSRQKQQRSDDDETTDQFHLRLGETVETAGLLTFLELAAAELHIEPPNGYGYHGSSTVGSKVSKITGSEYATLQDNGSSDSAAIQWIRCFLERYFGDQSTGEGNPFSQIFGCLRQTLLASSGAETTGGADGLDYPVLQACFDYEPIKLSPEQAEKWLHLRRTLRARESRSDYSSASGYHGIETKGSITAIIRSHLGREDFVDRVYLNQVLYFDRHAPRKEPRRVLLLWIIDRGANMQVRTPGLYRRDTAARQLVAWMLEDAVRHFADLPVLDLRVAIVMHDGGTDMIRYNAKFQPPPEVIARAPSPLKKNNAIWMPKVPGCIWMYFLRQPIWLQCEKARTAAASKLPAHHRMMALLPKIIRPPSLTIPFDDERHAYDFCNITVVGPSSEIQTSGPDVVRAARLVSRIAAHTLVSYMLFDERNITWVSPGRMSDTAEAEDDYRKLPLDGSVRYAAWNTLVKQLSAL